jgi:hypothetical protein
MGRRKPSKATSEQPVLMGGRSVSFLCSDVMIDDVLRRYLLDSTNSSDDESSCTVRLEVIVQYGCGHCCSSEFMRLTR